MNDSTQRGILKISKEEAEAIYDLVDMLSGGSPENVFSNDGEDSYDDPLKRVFANIYFFAGRDLPNKLRREDIRNSHQVFAET